MPKTAATRRRGPTSSGQTASPKPWQNNAEIEHALNERVKELCCLYGITRLVEDCQGSVDRLMQGVVELLPPAWQYPDVACARVLFEDKEYRTAGFSQTQYRQAADIVVAGKTIGAVEVYYLEKRPESDEGPFLKEERALIDAVAERLARTIEHFRAEAERVRIEHDLNERAKELRCLYGIAQLREHCQDSLDRLMQGAVELLPPAWQYPDVACARVLFEDKEYRTAGFSQTRYRQAADIIVAGRKAGAVEVCYLKKRPQSDEGPFLKEERALIDALAERLGRAAASIAADEALRSAHAQLQIERKALQETNAALRTVLARIEDEKSSIKQAVVANVEKILIPIVHALEAELTPDQKGYARLLRHNLEEIASPLVDRLSRIALALTPAEIRVCSMIKMGLSTKEIANLRRVAPATVSRQRENIRKKLGLAGRNANLATYLQTFSAGISWVDRQGRYGLGAPAQAPVRELRPASRGGCTGNSCPVHTRRSGPQATG